MLKSRFAQEPISRSQTPLSEMISNTPSKSPDESASELSLPEDIQLYMCAMYPEVWKCAELLYKNKEDNTLIEEQEQVRDRLDLWKRKLNGIQTPQLNDGTSDLENYTNSVPLRFYYGVEDPTTPNLGNIALNRLKTIHAETVTLYHLLNIHLHSPIRTLRNSISPTPPPQAPVPENARGQRQESHIRQWANTPSARRAAWHSICLLSTHKSASASSSTSSPAPRAIPPFAISTAASVVRGYCSRNTHGCTLCCASLLGPVSTVDLDVIVLDGADGGGAGSWDLEWWFRYGGRAAVAGLCLCRCNEALLLARLAVTGNGTLAGP
jgi:hypothetical protein